MDHTNKLSDTEGSLQPSPINKRKRPFWRRLHHWITHYPLELVMLLVLFSGILLLLNPLPAIDQLMDLLPIGIQGRPWRIGQWLAYEGGAQISGGGILVLIIGIGLYRARHIMLYRKSLWSTHCPNCLTPQLKRIHRTRLDRLLNGLTIPVKRYHCSSCHWQGRRIDEQSI